MPDVAHSLVTNTTPLIALAVGVGNLDILRTLYDRVVVPLEVCEEIHAHGNDASGVYAFDRADWLERLPAPTVISPYLRNTLDRARRRSSRPRWICRSPWSVSMRPLAGALRACPDWPLRVPSVS